MDIERVKAELAYIAVGDHMGDVNNALPALCKALDLPAPRWCESYSYYIMDWLKDDHDCGDAWENHYG